MVTAQASITRENGNQKLENPQELMQRISEMGEWFHNINLNGVWTAPNHFLGDFPNVKWKSIAPAIPQDLTGATVLDIGCNGGFHSIEFKRRGASRVRSSNSPSRRMYSAQKLWLAGPTCTIAAHAISGSQKTPT